VDVRIVGNALNTEGFLAYQYALSPIAVITFGFITDCGDIWTNSDVPITTTWVSSEVQTDLEVCAD
jgi:hypothetical protein